MPRISLKERGDLASAMADGVWPLVQAELCALLEGKPEQRFFTDQGLINNEVQLAAKIHSCEVDREIVRKALENSGRKRSATTIFGEAPQGGAVQLPQEPVHSESMGNGNPASSHPKVLVFTVNENETTALVRAFEVPSKKTYTMIDGHLYTFLGTLQGADYYHVTSEMGTSAPGAATMTIAHGFQDLKPKAVIAVGIAFGADPDKQKIGDVLVSKQLLCYDIGKLGPTGPIARGDHPSASSSFIGIFKTIAQMEKEQLGYSVHFGPVLSGDKLVNNSEFKKGLLKEYPEAIGGEMEGSGMYTACHDSNSVSWILIKAICDWADGNKDMNKQQNQLKAAANAAEFFHRVANTVPLVD